MYMRVHSYQYTDNETVQEDRHGIYVKAYECKKELCLIKRRSHIHSLIFNVTYHMYVYCIIMK